MNIQKIYKYSFYILVSSLVWGITIAIYGILIFSLIQFVFLFYKRDFSFKVLFQFIPLLLYFTIHLVSLTYSDNINFAKNIIETKASFIVLPLLIWGNINKKVDIRKILQIMSISFIFYLIICELYGFINSIHFHEVKGLIFDSVVRHNGTWAISFHQSIIRNTNYLFGNYYSFLIHTSYAAMYINTVKILIFEKIVFRNLNKLKIIFIVSFLEINIFQFQSKAGLIASFIIYIYYFSRYLIINKYYLKSIIYGFILIVFIISSFIFFPRLDKIRSSIEKGESVVDVLEKYTYRYGIWSSSISVIRRNFLIGTGLGDSQTELQKEYKSKNYLKEYENKYNSHNQFLQDFVSLGILGFISLCLIFINLFITCFKKKYILWYFIPVLTLIIFNFLFESMLQRVYGIFYFISIYILIIIESENNYETNI